MPTHLQRNPQEDNTSLGEIVKEKIQNKENMLT